MFFIQDAIKFPDLIHAAKQEPDRGFPQAQTAHDNFWDFVSLMPESTHMLMWAMSDRAIPRSFRFMEGFGVHTFRFVERRGRVDVREVPLEAEARAAVGGVERGGEDQRRRPRLPPPRPVGRHPAGRLPRVGARAPAVRRRVRRRFDFDVLDATKIIPEELVPVRPIGRLVLDRVVDNFFAETEQVAFCTQNIVPGIDFTNDPLLQGRNFSYLDTQLKRLGSPNFTHLPVNAPKCPFANFQQDGHMAMVNPVGRVNYEPNSWPAEIGGPREDPERGFRVVPGRGGGREAPAAARELRRPLQPGPPVLREPDADRAAAHRRRVRVRAEQGRAARHPRADGRATCATSTRTSPTTSPTGSGSRDAARSRSPRPRSRSPTCRRRRR